MLELYFIIPVYRVEKYLPRCVDSVLAQTYDKCRIVLVDDGSPDGCPAICDRYAEEHPAIHVIHKENGGLADARNAGIDYVLSRADADDCVTFLDSDDFVAPSFAAVMTALCKENACSVAQCGYEKGEGDAFSEAAVAPNTAVCDAESALLGYRLKSMSCAKVYRASCLADLRYRVGVLNEDEFFTYRAVYAGKTTAFTDEKLYYYYQHDTSIMSDIAKRLKNNPHRFDFLKAYEERIAFFEEQNKPEQVQKTREKICTDILLRYSEQMQLPRDDRDEECVNGTYMKLYRENYKQMIERKGIPFKRRLIYRVFYCVPYAAALMSKVLRFRK